MPKRNQRRKETPWTLLERAPEYFRKSIQDVYKTIHDFHPFTIVSMAFIAEPPTYTTNNTILLKNPLFTKIRDEENH
jgi:hypothetical protein